MSDRNPGVLVLVGGTLLITPGFLSDLVGLLFLLPPTRAAIRPMLTRLVAARFGVVGVLGDTVLRSRPSPSSPSSPSGPSPTVVEGEVVEPGQHEGPPPGGERP